MRDLGAADFYFFPAGYFLQIQATIEQAYVYKAVLEGELVGAILVLEYGDYAHYHLSARNRTYAKLAANNLLLWEAMQAAQQRGRKRFQLGGGSSNDPKNSLLKFKANFSSLRGAFYIGKKVHQPKQYQAILQQWRTKNNIDPIQESKNILRYKTKS
jgi:lipid II:glycine glycyltransferase (peptidoglycan interpeptide bridge formation enzyme)